ncbi:siroheme synthase CysG [Erythrobacter sp. SD-21]|uniref:siroheme synthase CysG n=1 Tax=Erythrobacter sp. SD-21 TaxID=161528 RepID=UPI000153F5AD|nr:siroheme synthase CysG [Erythrobacter sp. SD-21]EDL49358.1 uroporphyrin-III C-methyltransferase [Erythrobacter sp. SD-21]
MRYLPIFLDTSASRIIVSGAGEAATAKLRLLVKSQARITVFGSTPTDQVTRWAAEGRVEHVERFPSPADLAGADILYIAREDSEDAMARDVAMGRAAGLLVSAVDTPALCDFITPAIVDRDPVVIAIGTEGTAPMLARQLKARIEGLVSQSTGELAKLAATLRHEADAVAAGSKRRGLWARFFGEEGRRAFEEGGAPAAEDVFETLLHEAGTRGTEGHVALVGAGPGDPELLTRKAHRLLGDADVVIHDRLVSPQVMELARREAQIIEVGKSPYGTSWKQEDIDALIVAEAQKGQKVVRLKSGDPGIYGRLDEEVTALERAGVSFEVVPGITAAIAGAAELGQSLTRRGRNSSLRFLTGHDIDGFAEHDWNSLAAPGATAAIYMGVRAARFIQGRLIMHGAHTSTPVTVIENVSRLDRKQVAAKLADLPEAMAKGGIKGPAILYLGIAPRTAQASGLIDERTATHA